MGKFLTVFHIERRLFALFEIFEFIQLNLLTDVFIHPFWYQFFVWFKGVTNDGVLGV